MRTMPLEEPRRQRGFTLIELLATVTVLVILSSLGGVLLNNLPYRFEKVLDRAHGGTHGDREIGVDAARITAARTKEGDRLTIPPHGTRRGVSAGN